ncbi:hypothetical protein G6F63_015756 [Rhizopus arrhizus]|nr:hypothetical protein G6F63_015756 [Rhizopus arrhizus]
MGLAATNKWPGETNREWGTPITMDADVKKRVDDLWGQRGFYWVGTERVAANASLSPRPLLSFATACTPASRPARRRRS